MNRSKTSLKKQDNSQLKLMERYNISESKSPLRDSMLRLREKNPQLDQSMSAQSLTNLSVVSHYLKASQEEKSTAILKIRLSKGVTMSQKSSKKHFFRTKNQVNKHYILSPDEIATEKQTRYLFEKFDIDKSGGLDNEELEALFREFHIEVDSNMINQMFGVNMHFNLDNFLKMNHSKKQL